MELRYVKKFICASRDILFCVAFLYLAEILGMMAGTLIYEVVPKADMNRYLYIAISTLFYIAFLSGGMKLYEKKVLRVSPQRLGKLSLNGVRNIVVLVLTELIYIVLTILLVVVVCPGHWEIVPEHQSAFIWFRAIIDFGVGAGVAEEIVFRGTMLTALKKQFGKEGAIVGTSLIFSFLHIMNMTTVWGILVTGFFTMILGMILCLIKYKTETLLAPMVFHALWNIVFLGGFNAGRERNLYTIATYVTKSPLCDLIPLVASIILLFALRKIDFKNKKLP